MVFGSGVVHGSVVMGSLNNVLENLKKGEHWIAFVELKKLVDTLVPGCCTDTEDNPLPCPENGLKVQTDLEGIEELDSLKQQGKCRVKVKLTKLAQDLESIRYKMEVNKYGGLVEELEEIVFEMNKLNSGEPGTGSKYEDFAVYGDLVLKARSEVKKLEKNIFLNYVTADECLKLLEKYVCKAYELGLEEKPLYAFAENNNKKASPILQACSGNNFSLASKENNDGFEVPPRKEVADLFEGKQDFERKEEAIDAVYNIVTVPSLMGLDYADIRAVIAGGSKFKFISTFADEIAKYQEVIDSSFGVIVMCTGGPEDTLGYVNAVLEEYFSKVKYVVPTARIDPNRPSGNLKMDILLSFK